MEHCWRLRFHMYISDFANILKSFVGSNFLSIPFGFGQCGLVLGVVGLVAIGTLTAHCCHLLIKSKYHAIQHIVGLQRHPNNFSHQLSYRRKSFLQWKLPCFKLFTDHLINPDELKQEKSNIATKEDSLDVQKRLVKSLQYGDLARMCFGQWGVTFTNAAILITQTGFCVNYAIFTANALMSFFPVYTCTIQLQNNVSIVSPDCQYLVNSPWQPWLEEQWNKSKTDSNLFLSNKETDSVPDHLVSAARNEGNNNGMGNRSIADSFVIVNTSTQKKKELLAGSQSGVSFQDSTINSNSSNAASSIEVFANTNQSTTIKLLSSSISPQSSSTPPSPTAARSVKSPSFAQVPESVNPVSKVTDRQETPLINSAAGGEDTPPLSMLTAAPGDAVWSETWTDGPDLWLLFLFPLVIFILLVLPRQMRGVGVISTVGNLALVTGALVILIAVVAQFHVSNTWLWVRLEGLPIFFGTTSSAFEGAGAIMLVEASMEGNRHNFAPYLSWVIAALIMLHICTCVLSYLSFGKDIAQLVTMNIQVGSGLSVMVNVCLMVGILFTFPIMVFPVVYLVEEAILGKGSTCKGKRDNSDDTMQLLSEETKKPSSPTSDVLLKVPSWKRNVFRISLVLVIVLLGILLRDSFAYVAAFIGALGSTFVAFILPCMFHLRLCWHRLSMSIKIKDLSIIAVGVVFCITGVYSVVRDMTG